MVASLAGSLAHVTCKVFPSYETWILKILKLFVYISFTFMLLYFCPVTLYQPALFFFLFFLVHSLVYVGTLAHFNIRSSTEFSSGSEYFK